MIYLYDKSICDDLNLSFNPDSIANPAVKVIDPEGAINIAAQIQNDEINYPLVVLSRNENIEIDKDRYNFTRAKKGIIAGFNNEANVLIKEKAVPINLEYDLTIITTNTADMDEMIKELLFKYSDMYFLSIKLPYEIRRNIRFGLQIDKDAGIQSDSRTFEYISQGKLYQSILKLKCEGCVLVSYTPIPLSNFEAEIDNI